MSDKALELLKPKAEFKKEIKPVTIEKAIQFRKLGDIAQQDDTISISSQKLRDVIQDLKKENISDSDSSEDGDNNSKFNMFKTIKPKTQIKFSKQIILPSSSIDNKGTINIPKDKFIDLLERSRLEREERQRIQNEEEERKQKEQKAQRQQKLEQKLQNKYLSELLSMDSDLDLTEDDSEGDNFMEYKLRKQLSLDDF